MHGIKRGDEWVTASEPDIITAGWTWGYVPCYPFKTEELAYAFMESLMLAMPPWPEVLQDPSEPG